MTERSAREIARAIRAAGGLLEAVAWPPSGSRNAATGARRVAAPRSEAGVGVSAQGCPCEPR